MNPFGSFRSVFAAVLSMMLMASSLTCADGDAASIDPGTLADAGSDISPDSGDGSSVENKDISVEDARPLTPLEQVAQIVTPNCAVAACHDSITHQHGMDLSTAAGIYGSWVNQKGLDHCKNKLLLRVIPGKPDGSYVMTKITATMKACELWDPMPPPPRQALTAAEIETVRSWILAGAPSDDSDAAGDAAAGSDTDAPPPPPSSTPIPAIDYDALFVVNGGDASLTVINTEKNEAAATIKLQNASYPHHVYLSPDRTKLALALPGMDLSDGHGGHGGGTQPMTGAVVVMDATTGATLAARVLDEMNHNAIFSRPSGALIWTSQMTTPGSVILLDPMTLETTRTIAVGDQPAEVTFSADGRYGFVANGGSASVTVIDAFAKMVVKTIAVGQNPVGAWLGSNGMAYVDNETDKTLSAIDTATFEVKLTYNLGFMPGMAALGPDGNVWVTDSSNGKVAMFMPDQDVKVGEVATGAGAHGIAFSGDQKTTYISNQGAGTVSVIDLATRGVTSITVGSKPNGMAWRAK